MSAEFVIILAGPPRTLHSAWFPLNDALERQHFFASSAVFRMEADTTGAAFELLDPEDVEDLARVPSVRDRRQLGMALESWGGLFLQYARQDISLGLSIGCATGHTNYHLRFSTRVLADLFGLNDIARLYRLIGSLAEAASATSGFGERDLDLLNAAPAGAVRAIWSTPDNPDYPSSIGVLGPATLPEEEVLARARDLFEVTRLPNGYYVLAENDFLEIYRSLASYTKER